MMKMIVKFTIKIKFLEWMNIYLLCSWVLIKTSSCRKNNSDKNQFTRVEMEQELLRCFLFIWMIWNLLLIRWEKGRSIINLQLFKRLSGLLHFKKISLLIFVVDLNNCNSKKANKFLSLEKFQNIFTFYNREKLELILYLK